MLTFVINLDRSAERLTYMRDQLDRLGVAFERVPAVDGLHVPPDLAPYFAHIQRGKPPIIDDGAVGCYASHLKAYKHIVETGVPYALVLEDDANLPTNLQDVLNATLRALPEGWDFVHLCRPHTRAIRPLTPLPYGASLVRYSRIPAGTTGYLISQAGARKLLNPTIPRFWAIDTDTRRPWVFGLDVYGVAPNPIGHGGFSTTIPRMRVSARRGLPRPTPYSWSNFPFRTPAALAFNLRKLGVRWWMRCFTVNCGAVPGPRPASPPGGGGPGQSWTACRAPPEC